MSKEASEKFAQILRAAEVSEEIIQDLVKQKVSTKNMRDLTSDILKNDFGISVWGDRNAVINAIEEYLDNEQKAAAPPPAEKPPSILKTSTSASEFDNLNKSTSPRAPVKRGTSAKFGTVGKSSKVSFSEDDDSVSKRTSFTTDSIPTSPSSFFIEEPVKPVERPMPTKPAFPPAKLGNIPVKAKTPIPPVKSQPVGGPIPPPTKSTPPVKTETPTPPVKALPRPGTLRSAEDSNPAPVKAPAPVPRPLSVKNPKPPAMPRPAIPTSTEYSYDDSNQSYVAEAQVEIETPSFVAPSKAPKPPPAKRPFEPPTSPAQIPLVNNNAFSPKPPPAKAPIKSFNPPPMPVSYPPPKSTTYETPYVTPVTTATTSNPSSTWNAEVTVGDAQFHVIDYDIKKKSNGKNDFVLYRVEIQYGGSTWTIFRKFDDFELIDGAFKRELQGYSQYLPDKPYNYKDIKFSDSFLEERRKKLHDYMQLVLKNRQAIFQGRMSRDFFLKFLSPQDKKGDVRGDSAAILSKLK